MPTVRPIRPIEEAELLAIIDRTADAYFDRLLAAWAAAVAHAVRKSDPAYRLVTALRQRNVSAVVSSIDWQALEAGLTNATKVRSVLQLFEDLMVEGARVGRLLVPARPLLPSPLTDEQFKARVHAWVERFGAARVRGITEQTRKGLRLVLAESWRGSTPYQWTAKELRGLIGLDARQGKALARYAQQLVGSVQPSGRKRTAGEISRMVETRRRRMIAERSVRIARTEAYQAAAVGMREWWREQVRQGNIDADAYRREWVARPAGADPPVCPWCRALDGKRIKISGERWKSSQYGAVDNPPLHVRCLCGQRLVPVELPEVEPGEFQGDVADAA